VTVNEARQQLHDRFTNSQEGAINQQLQRKGLNPDDVDFKLYNGFERTQGGINDAQAAGRDINLNEFQNSTGVKVTGLSDGKPQYDEASLREYADQGNVDINTAREQLDSRFEISHGAAERTAAELRGQQVGGHGDEYDPNYVLNKQAAEGRTIIFRTDDDNMPREPFQTSGQAIVDEHAMQKAAHSGNREILDTAGRLDPDRSADSMMEQQVNALGKIHDNPEKAAKALLRADKAGALRGMERSNPERVKIAQKLRSNPQETLRDMSPEQQADFIQRTSRVIRELDGAVRGERS
jgi:hypothetical protein